LIKITDTLQPPPAPVVTPEPNTALTKELAELRRALAESSLNRDKAIASAVGELRAAFDDQVKNLKAAAKQAQDELNGLKATGDMRVTSLQALLDAEKAKVVAMEGSLASRDGEELSAKRAEQAHLDAMDLLRAQVKSPALVFANSQAKGAVGGNGSGAGGRTLSADEAFLNSAPALVVQEAERMQAPDRTLAQGSVVQAALQVAINSDLPGNVVAVVSEPVPAFSGDSILIPRGSRLFGSYSAGIEAGQARILIAWTRILTPDGVSMNISAVGGDSLGRSGLTGFVDTKFGARFGGATLISMIGAAPSVAAAQVKDKIAADTLADVGSNLQDATSSVIADQLALKPTIYVDQGARVTVLVDRDVVIY
ncbi:TrbI/VirB10 family protein, partial [Pseudorhodobacter sp.]|uniref:TrbI/VirB10 family protein n=1 Tax=Pseudorhodobacter sp. TaxID=1934400 RepID=UPI002647C826